MSKEIHDPQAHPVVSPEDAFEDRAIGIALSGSGGGRLSIGGSDGDSRKYAANVAGSQWSARTETA